MAIKFEYDETGKLIVLKNGKKVGEIETIGDDVKRNRKNKKEKEHEH